MSAFGLYLIGIMVLGAGILIAAHILGVATQWLIVIALVMIGLGVITGVAKTKRRDTPTDQTP